MSHKWKAVVRATPWHNRGVISAPHIHLCSEGTGNVHIGEGGPHHTSSKRCSQEEAGGYEDGGADEGGEEGAVDGLPPGPRLGQKRPMSWPLSSRVLPSNN